MKRLLLTTIAMTIVLATAGAIQANEITVTGKLQKNRRVWRLADRRQGKIFTH